MDPTLLHIMLYLCSLFTLPVALELTESYADPLMPTLVEENTLPA